MIAGRRKLRRFVLFVALICAFVAYRHHAIARNEVRFGTDHTPYP